MISVHLVASATDVTIQIVQESEGSRKKIIEINSLTDAENVRDDLAAAIEAASAMVRKG